MSLDLYIKKFPTDAIVECLKKSFPSSGITLDCGPEKIDGRRRYIILAAIAVTKGAPQPLYRSLILLKHTQHEASCAFRILLSSCGDKMQNGKQASEKYDTYGADSIELHPENFQVHCRGGSSLLLAPCMLPAPAFHINTHTHCTRWLQ